MGQEWQRVAALPPAAATMPASSCTMTVQPGALRSLPIAAILEPVGGMGGNRVYAVGGDGAIWGYFGPEAGWEIDEEAPNTFLFDVWGGSADYVYIAGSSPGGLWRFTRSQFFYGWAPMNVGTENSLLRRVGRQQHRPLCRRRGGDYPALQRLSVAAHG